jgi:hypothetical protein
MIPWNIPFPLFNSAIQKKKGGKKATQLTSNDANFDMLFNN